MSGNNPFGMNIEQLDKEGEEIEVNLETDQKEDSESSEESETQDSSQNTEEESEETVPTIKVNTEEDEKESESEEETDPDEKLKSELEDFNKEGDEGTSEEEKEGSDSQEDSPDNPFLGIASALREQGALTTVDEEDFNSIQDAESLVSALQKDKDNREYSDLTEEQKEYLESIRNGIPEDAVRRTQSNKQKLNSISDDQISENEDLQKNLVKQDLIQKGFDEDRASRYIEATEANGELEDEAKKSLETLREQENNRLKQLNEQAEKEKEEQKKKEQEKLEELKNNIYQKEEIIPEVPLNQTTKDEVYKSMTSIAGYDNEGNPLDAIGYSYQNDPDYSAKLHYIHYITNGLKDFSKITKSASSSATKKLNEQLNKQGSKQGKPKGTPQGGKSRKSSDITSALEHMFPDNS